MCGILGQINIEKPVERETFGRMLDTLIHRGPDGFGIKVLNEGKAALGHRRLSIIDLTDAATQPMTNEDGTLWITFNGEIYNYTDLRTELIKSGHVFSSNSDTEVILHGYEQWGEEVVDRLNGMFAFGIWDENTRSLFLARDRFGIKPLYYYQDEKSFIFASEIKAIVANSAVRHTLDADSVSDFFVYRFIPSPRSVWKEIKKLPPAHTLRLQANGTLSTHQYWTIPFDNRMEQQDIAKERCEQLLEEAVRSHLVSDVPVGVFLSGGYDSSAVTHYMHSLGYPIQSFSIGFPGWEKSEHESAKEVADLYHTEHHQQMLEEADLTEWSNLSYYYDEPLGGSSFLPTYHVSKLAATKVKVVLSGDGGDEVFAGYKWHSAIYKKYHTPDLKQLLSRTFKGKKEYLLGEYFNMMSWAGFHYKDMTRLLGDMGSNHGSRDDVWFYKSYLLHRYGAVKAFQLLDFHSFLPEVVLTKVDRASMANSLEVRVPFLDHRLAEYTMGLSQSALFQYGTTKKILNSVLTGKLPSSVMSKPKRGFGAPINHMDISDCILMLRASEAYRNDLINTNYVEREIIGRRDVHKLWALKLFVNWADRWT